MNWQKLAKMSHSDLKRLQESKLRQFITNCVYPYSPHYRYLFDKQKIDPKSIRTIDDLRRIPFTSKKDLLSTKDNPKKFKDFVLQPDKFLIKKYAPLKTKLGLLAKKIFKGQARLEEDLKQEYKPVNFTATTGRSSEQVMFLYTRHDLENLKKAGARLFNVVQANEDWRAMNIFPFAPHLAFWQTYYASVEAGVFSVPTGGGKTMGTQGNINLIEKLKAQMLIGVPSYIYHLLRQAEAENRDFSDVKLIVLGAEKVPSGLKDKMIELLTNMGANEEEVNIVGTYGFTEAKTAWGEFPTPSRKSSGYFTYPDMEIFEVINPETGEVVSEGEDGELVYTNLSSRGSVVLRYRTGDIVKGGMIYTEPCPYSGYTVPRINSTITRVSNQKDLQLTKVKGTLVSLDAMAHVLMDEYQIEEWAVEIRKQNDDPFGLDELVLYVAPKDSAANQQQLTKKLQDNLLNSAEVTPNKIIYQTIAEVAQKIGLETELKEKRFFDLRD